MVLGTGWPQVLVAVIIFVVAGGIVAFARLGVGLIYQVTVMSTDDGASKGIT